MFVTSSADRDHVHFCTFWLGARGAEDVSISRLGRQVGDVGYVRECADDVALREVLAHEELGGTEAGIENA